MNSYFLRPDLPHEGDRYWPCGIPSLVIEYDLFTSRFVDRDGRHFEIAYTSDQIDSLVARYGFFAPWMPMCVVEAVEVKPVDHIELAVEISDGKGLDGPVDPT